MKSFTEYTADSLLEKYLLNEVCIAIEYYKHFNTSNIYEYHEKFENYDLVIKKISEHILKEIDDFNDLKNKDGHTFKIDCSDCNAYCSLIEITIKYSKDGQLNAYAKPSKNDIIDLTLCLTDSYDIDMNLLEGIILHELLHMYENNQRLKNGKLDIFSELSDAYYNAQQHISKNFDPDKAIVTMKYYLDPKERNAFFAMLENDIKRVCKKVIPSKDDYKVSSVINEIKKIPSWQRYFEFCKFATEIRSYTDKQLQQSYYRAINTIEKQHKDLNDKITYHKEITYDKSASEIRKEIKGKYEKFVKKFNQLFPKVYYDYLNNVIEL